MAVIKLVSCMLFMTTIAVGASVNRRAVVPHDEVVGFPQTVPDGTTGALDLRYKPYLYVASGCVTFPAVSPAGKRAEPHHLSPSYRGADVASQRRLSTHR